MISLNSSSLLFAGKQKTKAHKTGRVSRQHNPVARVQTAQSSSTTRVKRESSEDKFHRLPGIKKEELDEPVIPPAPTKRKFVSRASAEALVASVDAYPGATFNKASNMNHNQERAEMKPPKPPLNESTARGIYKDAKSGYWPRLRDEDVKPENDH